MRTIFIVGLTIIGIVVGIWNQFGAMLLYWWYAIFRPLEWVFVDLHSWRPSLVIGILVIVRSLMGGYFPRISHPLSLGMIGLLGLEAIASSYAGCGSKGLNDLDQLARMFLILFFTDSLIQTRRHFFLFMLTVAVSFAAWSSKAGLVSLFAGGASLYGYVGSGGSFTGSNAFAMGASMTVFLLIGVGQNIDSLFTNHIPEVHQPLSRKIFKVALWGAALLSAYCVFATFSRGNFLGLATGAFALLMLQRKRLKLLFFVILLVLPLSIIFVVPEGYLERLESITHQGDELDQSAAARPHYWDVATLMVSAYPLGIGAGCYTSYYDEFDFLHGELGFGRSVHNSHLQVLVEAGFLGAFVWIFLLIYSLSVLYKIRSRSLSPAMPVELGNFLFTFSNSLFASLVAFIIGGIFYELAHLILVWVVVISAVVLDRFSVEFVREAKSLIEQSKLELGP